MNMERVNKYVKVNCIVLENIITILQNVIHIAIKRLNTSNKRIRNSALEFADSSSAFIIKFREYRSTTRKKRVVLMIPFDDLT